MEWISSISVRKSYDISQLGLSEKAVKGLVTKTTDVEMLNRLLENPKFPQLLNLIRIYFEDTVALGMMSRNDMINMATTSLTEYMQQNPAHKEEVKHDIRLLNAQKFGEHEAEMERIKSIFLSILREIKSDIANHHMPEQTANSELLQNIITSAKENPPVTLDDALSMVTDQMSQVVNMDDEMKEILPIKRKDFVLLHGDFSLNHILFNDENVVCGVLDFGDSRIGKFKSDFIYLLDDEDDEEFGAEFGKLVLKKYESFYSR